MACAQISYEQLIFYTYKAANAPLMVLHNESPILIGALRFWDITEQYIKN